MNKRFFIAWIALFVVWMVGSFVVHGMLLHDDYARLANLFRPEAEAHQYFPLMILAHVLMAGAFAWIYAQGVDGTSWTGQGLRYGLAVALLTVVPWYLIYYVVQPMPLNMVIKQIVFDAILLLILGLVAAFVYRQPEARMAKAPA
jgi:hypothetical protein